MHNKLHGVRERVRTPRHITCGNIFAYLMMIIIFSLLACLLRSQVNSNRCMIVYTFAKQKDLAKIPTNQPPISSHRSGKSSIAILSIATLIESSVMTCHRKEENNGAPMTTREILFTKYMQFAVWCIVHVCAPLHRPNWLWLYVHSTRAFVFFLHHSATCCCGSVLCQPIIIAIFYSPSSSMCHNDFC